MSEEEIKQERLKRAFAGDMPNAVLIKKSEVFIPNTGLKKEQEKWVPLETKTRQIVLQYDPLSPGRLNPPELRVFTYTPAGLSVYSGAIRGLLEPDEFMYQYAFPEATLRATDNQERSMHMFNHIKNLETGSKGRDLHNILMYKGLPKDKTK